MYIWALFLKGKRSLKDKKISNFMQVNYFGFRYERESMLLKISIFGFNYFRQFWKIAFCIA